jgi:hypothetical protein
LYDDTNNAQLGRLVNSATTENEWLFAVCTYDGSATNAGMNLYKQGVDADDANGNSGSFTNMVAGAATLTLGFKVHPADIFNGLMAGGPLGPIFTQIELTADQVLELYQHDRALLGV